MERNEEFWDKILCVGGRGGWKGRKEAENTSVARNMTPPLLNFSTNIFRKSLPI